MTCSTCGGLVEWTNLASLSPGRICKGCGKVDGRVREDDMEECAWCGGEIEGEEFDTEYGVLCENCYEEYEDDKS